MDNFHRLLLTYEYAEGRVSTLNKIKGLKIQRPFSKQGLSDAEESVVVAAIEAMTALTELGLFPTYLQCDLLAHTAPLLIHPNLWIRQV